MRLPSSLSYLLAAFLFSSVSGLQSVQSGSEHIKRIGRGSSNLLRNTCHAVVHLCVGTYGCMVSAAILVYTLFPLARTLYPDLQFRTFNRVLSLPYFPLQILMGLITGYLGQLKLRSKAARWIWLVPLAVLVIQFFSLDVSVFESSLLVRVDHFFGSACRPPACFDQIRYTAPFYTAVAYSIGTLLYPLKLGGWSQAHGDGAHEEVRERQ
jgi:hypothetical protein